MAEPGRRSRWSFSKNIQQKQREVAEIVSGNLELASMALGYWTGQPQLNAQQAVDRARQLIKLEHERDKNPQA